MVVESVLLNYGVLGAFAVLQVGLIRWFMLNQDKRESKLIQVIEDNAKVLTQLCERINQCSSRK
jgi:hypothetical protein